MDVVLALVGIAASGFFSWLFTHLYYRKALVRQVNESSAQLATLTELITQGKHSADLNREVLRQRRIQECVDAYRRESPVDRIDSYSDLSNTEKAELLDAVFLRVKGRKPRANKYRGERLAT